MQTRKCRKLSSKTKLCSLKGLKVWLWIIAKCSKWASFKNILINNHKSFLVRCPPVIREARTRWVRREGIIRFFNLSGRTLCKAQCRVSKINMHLKCKKWTCSIWRILNKLPSKILISNNNKTNTWGYHQLRLSDQWQPRKGMLTTISDLAQIWMSGQSWHVCKTSKPWRKSRARTTSGSKSKEKWLWCSTNKSKTCSGGTMKKPSRTNWSIGTW